jgi:hypothetical protein
VYGDAHVTENKETEVMYLNVGLIRSLEEALARVKEEFGLELELGDWARLKENEKLDNAYMKDVTCFLLLA